MFSKRFDVFRLFGFPIRVDLSWFIIAVLVTWSLAENLFPVSHPNLGQLTYWWMGGIGALGLFASVILHELGHAVMARRDGLRIQGITLFIFGGVAELLDEPPNPKVELRVAVAGPMVSAALGVVCLSAGRLVPGPVPVVAVLSYLGMINLFLVGFNVIPALPLDGGRVLRALLWQWKGNVRQATRVASSVGAGFGTLLIALGVVAVLNRAFVAGMWWFLIGLFLRNAARMSYHQLLLRKALEGESVRRFMQTDVVKVPRHLSVQELVDDFVYRYHYKMFPVVDGERVVGCVTTRQIKEIPQAEWSQQSVGVIATPCSPENTVSPDADATAVLSQMRRSGRSRLMVMEADRLAGLITLKDMLDFLALKVELEEDW